jgi:hypothetical protein
MTVVLVIEEDTMRYGYRGSDGILYFSATLVAGLKPDVVDFMPIYRPEIKYISTCTSLMVC